MYAHKTNYMMKVIEPILLDVIAITPLACCVIHDNPDLHPALETLLTKHSNNSLERYLLQL